MLAEREGGLLMVAERERERERERTTCGSRERERERGLLTVAEREREDYSWDPRHRSTYLSLSGLCQLMFFSLKKPTYLEQNKNIHKYNHLANVMVT